LIDICNPIPKVYNEYKWNYKRDIRADGAMSQKPGLSVCQFPDGDNRYRLYGHDKARDMGFVSSIGQENSRDKTGYKG
jgi:hypothetical protein